MRVAVLISILLILSFRAFSCQDQQFIDNFFNNLDSMYKKSDYDDVIFYGKNKNSDEVLRITFAKAGNLSEFSDSYRHGFFQLESNKSIFHNVLVHGAFSPQYRTAGEIKSSIYNDYIEWNIDGRLRIFYENDGSLKKNNAISLK